MTEDDGGKIMTAKEVRLRFKEIQDSGLQVSGANSDDEMPEVTEADLDSIDRELVGVGEANGYSDLSELEQSDVDEPMDFQPTIDGAGDLRLLAPGEPPHQDPDQRDLAGSPWARSSSDCPTCGTRRLRGRDLHRGHRPVYGLRRTPRRSCGCAGEDFSGGRWHLGRWSYGVGWIAVVWVAIITVLFMLPQVAPITWTTFWPTAHPVVAVLMVIGFAGIYWLVSARNWFTGPKVQGTPEELAAIEQELASWQGAARRIRRVERSMERQRGGAPPEAVGAHAHLEQLRGRGG